MSNPYDLVLTFKSRQAAMDFKTTASNRGAIWNAYVSEDEKGKPTLCIRGSFYMMASTSRLPLAKTSFCQQMIKLATNPNLEDYQAINVKIAESFKLNDEVLTAVVGEHQREIMPVGCSNLMYYIRHGVPSDRSIFDLVGDLGGVACAHYMRYRLEQDKWMYSLDSHYDPSAYVEFHPDFSAELLPLEFRVHGICPVIKYNSEPRTSPNKLDVLMTTMLHHVMRTYDDELTDGECNLEKHPRLRELCDAVHIAALSKRNGWAWANQVDVIDKFLADYIECHRVSPP